MPRPQEAFNKKEFEKKKLQKRNEKEKRKEERKAKSKDGKSLDEMMAYVDENGNLTSTPPDPTKKKVINTEDIVIGSRNSGSSSTESPVRTGKITSFNTAKGFGFIKDSESGDNVFVHISGLSGPVQENDKVMFEVERGPKGFSAVRVKIVK
jgi:cold shock CspA family protein